VYVSFHFTQLNKPVKIWTWIRSPVGITANSKVEILVASPGSTTDILKYDAEGKRVVLVKKSGLVMPRCIACDDEDNIYCLLRSPLMVNMSPHLVRKVRRRESSTSLHIFK